MKIINVDMNEDFITVGEANNKVQATINNSSDDYLYILKYEGKIISISGQYYKFAWKSLRDIKNALTNKFGKDMSEALVENDVIEVIKLYI